MTARVQTLRYIPHYRVLLTLFIFLTLVLFQLGDEFGDCCDSPLDAPKVIVFMSSLLVLLSICKQPQCGSAVERENMKVVRNGAMIRVHMVCNNNHSTTWDSSPMLGTGKTAIAAINVLISTYCLLTGLHIKQVNIIFV